MNQQERDVLRYKHRCLESKVGPWCRSCMHGWPCDVIKVLDALDEVTPIDATSSEVHDGSEVSATREVCDHADWTSNVYSDDIYADMGYRYCPKCGERLL